MKHLDLNDLSSLNKRKSPTGKDKPSQGVHSLTHSEEEPSAKDKADKLGNQKEHAL